LTDRIVVPAVFLLSSSLFSAGCSAGPELTGTLEETVVSSTIRPANWDLYLFDEPGAAPHKLTTDPSPDYNPAFSPDGRWVVFTSDRHGTADLFALDLDGRGAPVRLTSSNAMDDAAAFSPDGRSLAFVSTRSGNPDIFVMPFAPEEPDAATHARNITRDEGGDFNPAFSPDGDWIAFSSNRDASDDLFWSPGAPDDYRAGDVYVMRPDGTDVRRLTEDPGWDGSPAWAPDGSLVFYSQRGGGAADRDAISESVGSGGLITRIHRMNSDGSGLEAVSGSGESALSPAITTEGRIAFSAQREDRWTIVSTEADGSELRVESDVERDYWAPAYDPNSGRMIAFGPAETNPLTRFETDAPGPFLANQPHGVDLPDRTLKLHAVRGYLPALNPAASEVATSEGFSRLVISRLDGTEMRVVFDSVRALQRRAAVLARLGRRYLEEPRRWKPSGEPHSRLGCQRCVAGLLAGRPAHRLPQLAGREHGDLPHERRRNRSASPYGDGGHEHHAVVLLERGTRRLCLDAGWRLRDLHPRSRGRWKPRRGAAHHEQPGP
jgi:sugar lactone lactonase YvrE